MGEYLKEYMKITKHDPATIVGHAASKMIFQFLLYSSVAINFLPKNSCSEALSMAGVSTRGGASEACKQYLPGIEFFMALARLIGTYFSSDAYLSGPPLLAEN